MNFLTEFDSQFISDMINSKHLGGSLPRRWTNEVWGGRLKQVGITPEMHKIEESRKLSLETTDNQFNIS